MIISKRKYAVFKFKNLKKYDRYSFFYNLLEFLPEKLFFANYRKMIIPALNGSILEIGVGTGKNLPYYTDKAEVIAVDFSKNMIGKARDKLRQLNKKNITLQIADVQNLPFPDNSLKIFRLNLVKSKNSINI